MRRLTDPRPAVRIRALRALARRGGREEIPLIGPCLRDDDPAVRGAANRALDAVGATRADRRALYEQFVFDLAGRREQVQHELEDTPPHRMETVDQGDWAPWGGDEPHWMPNPVETLRANPRYEKLRSSLASIERDLEWFRSRLRE